MSLNKLNKGEDQQHYNEKGYREGGHTIYALQYGSNGRIYVLTYALAEFHEIDKLLNGLRTPTDSDLAQNDPAKMASYYNLTNQQQENLKTFLHLCLNDPRNVTCGILRPSSDQRSLTWNCVPLSNEPGQTCIYAELAYQEPTPDMKDSDMEEHANRAYAYAAAIKNSLAERVEDQKRQGVNLSPRAENLLETLKGQVREYQLQRDQQMKEKEEKALADAMAALRNVVIPPGGITSLPEFKTPYEKFIDLILSSLPPELNISPTTRYLIAKCCAPALTGKNDTAETEDSLVKSPEAMKEFIQEVTYNLQFNLMPAGQRIAHIKPHLPNPNVYAQFCVTLANLEDVILQKNKREYDDIAARFSAGFAEPEKKAVPPGGVSPAQSSPDVKDPIPTPVTEKKATPASAASPESSSDASNQPGPSVAKKATVFGASAAKGAQALGRPVSALTADLYQILPTLITESKMADPVNEQFIKAIPLWEKMISEDVKNRSIIFKEIKRRMKELGVKPDQMDPIMQKVDACMFPERGAMAYAVGSSAVQTGGKQGEKNRYIKRTVHRSPGSNG